MERKRIKQSCGVYYSVFAWLTVQKGSVFISYVVSLQPLSTDRLSLTNRTAGERGFAPAARAVCPRWPHEGYLLSMTSQRSKNRKYCLKSELSAHRDHLSICWPHYSKLWPFLTLCTPVTITEKNKRKHMRPNSCSENLVRHRSPNKIPRQHLLRLVCFSWRGTKHPRGFITPVVPSVLRTSGALFHLPTLSSAHLLRY